MASRATLLRLVLVMVSMQAGASLNGIRFGEEGFECPQPVIEIKVFSTAHQMVQHDSHTAAKQHRRLTDETVERKPDARRRQREVTYCRPVMLLNSSP